MSQTPAEILVDAINAHRDAKYDGGRVTDPLDAKLYGVANWDETWDDHARDPDAPIPDDY